MQTALTIALMSASAVWLTFSVWYITRAKWWRTAFGWNTLGVSLIMTIIFTRLAVLYLHPSFKADLQATGLTLYILAAIFGAHRIYLLERAQRGQGK